MPLPLSSQGLCTLLLDIEGTTTPISFVTEVLFPFAREHVKGFLERNRESAEVRADLGALWQLHGEDRRQGGTSPPLRLDSPADEIASGVAYVHWLMDADRKATPLKSLQGKIWQEGYERGELRGQVFADVAPAFERWARRGKEIAIFSSGSVLAQKLLFGHSEAGDLTPFIRAYFDTTIGSKKEAESYRRIAAELGYAAREIVFVSDVPGELDAARAAGMQAVLSVRPGNAPVPAGHGYPVVRSFDKLFPD